MPETDDPSPFDEREIREAEQALAQALVSSDPTAWVFHYTEDAVFDAGGEAVQGRPALLLMAISMTRLTSMSIRSLRTEGSGNLATVWCEASWVSGSAETGSAVDVRGILVWRKEPDGRWRVAMERIG